MPAACKDDNSLDSLDKGYHLIFSVEYISRSSSVSPNNSGSLKSGESAVLDESGESCVSGESGSI